ncbi:MAG: CARDB domain-containing protein [Dehalococcoidia bacterium]|jgi:hypothetical protein
MKKAVRPLFVLASIVTLFLLAAGCMKVAAPTNSGAPVATLSNVNTATAVSSDGLPLSVASIFLANTPNIFVAATVSNAPEGTAVTAQWVMVKDSTGKLLNQILFNDSDTVTGTRNISFSHASPAGGWQAGQYAISLQLNGKEVTTTQFTVQSVQAANVPAPTISYFKATPDTQDTGQPVTLSWSTTDATSVDISGVGNVASQGTTIIIPINSVEYTLKATNAMGTTTAKVYVYITSYISDKPDLVITDFHVEGDKAFYTIKNIGGVPAKQSTTFLYVQGDNKASSLVDILPSGSERTLAFPNFLWSYGTARNYTLPVRICADGLKAIGEYNKDNNCMQINW